MVVPGKTESYKVRTLAGVVELNREGTDAILKKSRPNERQGFIGIDLYRSQVKVEYVGTPRVIPADRQGLMATWQKLQRVDKNFVRLYEKEHLFREGNTEYWIPVQRDMSARMEQTVKPGEILNLFVVYVGAAKPADADKFSPLFLATSFEK